MRTQVYAYKGFLGVNSFPFADGMIASPITGMKIGCVIEKSCVDVSPEALELIRKIPVNEEYMPAIDLIDHPNKEGVQLLFFASDGGYKSAYVPGQVCVLPTLNVDELPVTDGVEVPQEFIDFIEKKLAEGEDKQVA